MKSHNGMRPQDIVILLKIISNRNADWQYRDLSSSLIISVSEVSESLNRSHLAGLVDESRRRVYRKNLFEFIEHGLHYVFPETPGTMVTGVPTAHSHPAFAKIDDGINYVWPYENGDMRGLAITPLYKSVPAAVEKDELLHELLACLDVIRVGRPRELTIALEILKSEMQV